MMNKIRKVYKIVRFRESPDLYCSGVVGDYNDPFWTTYKIGEKSLPPEEYPLAYLFAFDTKERGAYWAKRYLHDCRLFKARASIVDDTPYAVDHITSMNLRHFWEGDYQLTSLNYTPRGTVWCKWIKLLEEIQL
jgi:hypothetical protein